MTEFDNLIFIISAPSGAGKTSLTKAVVKELANLQICVSHTTRNIRPGEINGVHYNFINTEEFLNLKNQNMFIESAKVFNHYYGTSKTAIEKILSSKKDVILEIDWQGANQVRDLYPNNSIGIFILPPSLSSLQERLQNRGQDDEKTIVSRLADAKAEISHYNNADYLVINDDFADSVTKLAAIITANRQKLTIQQKNHAKLLTELLA